MRKFLILTMLVGALAASAEDQRFETYSVAYTDPQAAEEVVRSVVGEEGTVTLDLKNQRLLVLTSADRQAQVASLMQKLNVAPRNVQIEVRFRNRGTTRESEASVTGNGQVVIGPGGAQGKIKLQPRIINETTRTSSDVIQNLLVASGRGAELNVGERVPYAEWILDYGFQHGYIQQRIGWQEVGSSLVVEPLVIGDGPDIRIRLTPRISGFVDGRRVETSFSELATEVFVRDGETFPLGGLASDQEFSRRFLVGYGKSGQEEALDITLTPRILAPGKGVTR